MGEPGRSARRVQGRLTTTRRGSFPSVRNPCERAGVSRFSAAALAPPLNKIDLKKKKKMEQEKKKRRSHVVTAPTHPAGKDPRRHRAPWPSNPDQPNSLQSWGRHSAHPTGKPGKWKQSSPPSSPIPLPLCKNLAPKAAPRPHSDLHGGGGWRGEGGGDPNPPSS